jgi:hypothetical protein
LCQDNFRGCDGLSYVALSVIRYMHQQTTDGCRQLAPADIPDLLQRTVAERPNPCRAYADGCFQL